jgi:hypothetical protein
MCTAFGAAAIVRPPVDLWNSYTSGDHNASQPMAQGRRFARQAA